MAAASAMGDQNTIRTPDAIKKKLYNFMALDPRTASKGLPRGSHLDPIVWNEFFQEPARLQREVEAILTRLETPARPPRPDRKRPARTINGLKATQIGEVERTPLPLRYRVLTLFLSTDLGYRAIEAQVFDRQRKGFLPWQIVRYYGFDEDDRGIYAGRTSGELDRLVTSALEDPHIPVLQITARSMLSGAPPSPAEVAKPLEQLAGAAHDQVTARKVRVGQAVLRELLLQTYQGCCALCENREPSQLVVSHIIPWSKDETVRLDPRNAVLLCRLHDGLFDAGLIGLDDDFQLVISARLDLLASPALRHAIDTCQFRPPSDFLPAPRFLAWHRRHHGLREVRDTPYSKSAATASDRT